MLVIHACDIAQMPSSISEAQQSAAAEQTFLLIASISFPPSRRFCLIARQLASAYTSGSSSSRTLDQALAQALALDLVLVLTHSRPKAIRLPGLFLRNLRERGDPAQWEIVFWDETPILIHGDWRLEIGDCEGIAYSLPTVTFLEITRHHTRFKGCDTFSMLWIAHCNSGANAYSCTII